MPGEILTRLAELIIAGEETDQAELVDRLILSGYEQMSLVQNAGEFSLRGGILDIFSPGFDYPLRLDFFGDFLETIRLFDPITQRSIQEIDEAEIIPVSDILFPADNSPEKISLLNRLHSFSTEFSWSNDEQDVIAEKINNSLKFPGAEFFLPLYFETLSDPISFLTPDTIIFLLDPDEIFKSIQLVWERIEANYAESQKVQSLAFPPDLLFLSESKFKKRLDRHQFVTFCDFETIELSPLQVMDHDLPVQQTTQSVSNGSQNKLCTNVTIRTGNHQLLKQHLELHRRKQGLIAPLVVTLQEWLNQHEQIYISCRSQRNTRHLAEMLNNHGIEVSISEEKISDIINTQTVTLSPYPLSEGFDLLDENIHFLSEIELFGEKRLSKSKKLKRQEETPVANFEELKIGDIVVHSSHGLGIYDGITNIKLKDTVNDFFQIIYKNNDKLFVPVDRINTISKYSGLSDKAPVISSLGSKKWQTTKNKIKEAVWKVAKSLLNLYAKRKLTKGISFSQPDSLYRELEESFPYDETSGQNKAINDVIADQTSDQCMDRLVCGDVGFGKTEVAIRAAFKVVCDGFQVAILVPTTVLAEQHAQTFLERFQGFPVTIECLNRFRTPAQQREIIKKLQEGKVDIIIGTHRILSKDVSFHKLGLLIIDEEHRFGVSHKEKLKHLRTGIDVLTLTATPIPRTLQMSLLGVRDLSIISSPPRNRQSVKTFIAKYDDLVIKEAIIRELQRDGQVFLVHNRVHSIHDLALKVQKLVPSARIAVAHGQMPGKNLEEIMVNFVHKRIDVLICTTIIESGLDIPNANTIITNRADRMGLAEIYQLRGRVGRSTEQAFAYLLVPSLDSISKDAKQRLRALMEYNELGGGFKLALSDLQIRGGGNILGESQSGNIAAIGYDLYLDLLQKTVDDLKRKAESGEETIYEDEIEPEINLTLSAYIPEKYISDPDQRYIAYKRISGVGSDNELEHLEEEFLDRYGALPQETKNLFLVISLKEVLKKLKIIKLEQGTSTLVFSFAENTPVPPHAILLFIRNSKEKVRLTPDGKLVVDIIPSTPQVVIETAKKILRSIV